MAFHEFDPLFGSVGVFSSQPEVWCVSWEETTTTSSSKRKRQNQGRRKRKRSATTQSTTNAPSSTPSNHTHDGDHHHHNNNDDDEESHTAAPSSATEEQGITRFHYEQTIDDVERKREERMDRYEKERSGETECLLCSLKDPDGSGNFQEVMDYYYRNRGKYNRDTLHRDVCEKYREKVYRLPAMRKGDRCTIPLLLPRHLRQHEKECEWDVFEEANNLAKILKDRIVKELERGVQVDTQTGQREIVPIGMDRALKNWLSLAKLAAARSDASSTTTTINVNSSSSRKGRRGGDDTGISVSALVGLQKERRQKRLDTYTLSRWGN